MKIENKDLNYYNHTTTSLVVKQTTNLHAYIFVLSIEKVMISYNHSIIVMNLRIRANQCQKCNKKLEQTRVSPIL